MLGENLRKIRKEKRLTQRRLAKDFNIAESTVSQWESNQRDPDSATIAKLAIYFGVSADYLVGTDNNIDISNSYKNVVKVPIYGVIPAGIPMEMIDTSFIEEYEEVDASILRGGHEYFGLKIKGRSMLPEFKNGDTIILRKQDDCESGQFCAVSINHTECTFKKVIKHDTGITLQPLNPEFEPKFYTNEQIAKMPITILGVVREVRRIY